MIKEETARAQPKASTCEWRQQKYTGTYDDQDRLLSYGPFDFTYTANGELETKTNRDTGEAWLFQYDALGSLLTVGLPNGDLVEYLVDGLGRRVGKKKNGVLLKQWIYRNALKPVAELDGSGALVSEFVYGSKRNVPDYLRRGAAAYRVVSDHLGSPRYVVNVANATDVPFTASYTSLGEVTGTGLDWMPFGFAGGIYDGDSGLVRFGKRDFDPATGRWISKEPLRFSGGRNFYVYAFNDPVNWIDPNGLLPFMSEGQAWEWIKHQLDRLTSYPDAVDAFRDNYEDMRDANTINADKYFHCKANCEAAARGRQDVAEAISDAREWTDEHLKGDPASACAADQAANRHGRNSGAQDEYECKKACGVYRPNGLGPQY